VDTISKLQKITFITLYVLVAYHLLINGSGLFQNWNSTWVTNTMIYLLGVAVFLGINEKIPRELGSERYSSKHNIYSILLGISLTFILSISLFILLYITGVYFQGVTAPPNKYIPAMMTYQFFIVVCSETIIFQVVILRIFRVLLYKNNMFKRPYWAILIQGLIFSGYHVTAYSFSWQSLIFAFLMGSFLGWCVTEFNVGVAVGFHWTWNAMVMGLFLFMVT